MCGTLLLAYWFVVVGPLRVRVDTFSVVKRIRYKTPFRFWTFSVVPLFEKHTFMLNLNFRADTFLSLKTNV